MTIIRKSTSAASVCRRSHAQHMEQQASQAQAQLSQASQQQQQLEGALQATPPPLLPSAVGLASEWAAQEAD